MALTAGRHTPAAERTAPHLTTSYKFRVFLLALVGYAYVFTILAALLAFIAVAIVLSYRHGLDSQRDIVNLALPFSVIALLILRSLWVRVPPPKGQLVSRQDAPSLFATLDELRDSLRSPRIDRVLLVDFHNAAVAQRPLLGLFGFHRNYLLIGLPLLQLLSPEQFRAVLAHELGHLSTADGRLSNWIYRMRATWATLEARLSYSGRFLFLPFFRWYVPFFRDYSFALARAREYRADQAAAASSGARQEADALIAMDLQRTFLYQHYWPNLHRTVGQQPSPLRPFAALPAAWRASIATAPLDKWLAAALHCDTDPEDTHPSLCDRLAALGQEPRIPPLCSGESAAEWAFGARCDHFIALIDEDWLRDDGADWDKRHRETVLSLTELSTLDHRAEQGALSLEETLRRAYLTEEFGDKSLALARFREALDRDPGLPDAQFAVGRLLLDAGDETGIALLDRAIDGAVGFVVPGCDLVADFLKSRGRKKEAEPYRQRALQQRKQGIIDLVDGDVIVREERYLPHGMTEDQVAAIAAHLATFQHVATAYLVRKAPEHFTDKPAYILGIVVERPWYLYRSIRIDDKLAHSIARAIDHPQDFAVEPLNNFGNNRLRKSLQALPDSQIYQRN